MNGGIKTKASHKGGIHNRKVLHNADDEGIIIRVKVQTYKTLIYHKIHLINKTNKFQ